MSWTLSSDIAAFQSAAGVFLEAEPVEHTLLLTEAAYLAGRRDVAGARFGWWQRAGEAVAGAFLQAPRHAPVLSLMIDLDGVGELADALPELSGLDVDGRMLDIVKGAWQRRGVELMPRSRTTLYRLGQFRAPRFPDGRARVATAADRDLLVGWFHQLMDRFPDDPSDLAYVIDDPLLAGGLTLWEVDGEPVAMAGRSPVVAGMTRLGAVHSVRDRRHGDAALAAACEAALGVARDVLVFAGAMDPATEQRAMGFEPVLDRVMLSEAANSRR